MAAAADGREHRLVRGSVIAIFSASGASPRARSPSSNIARVPEPGSRMIQSSPSTFSSIDDPATGAAAGITTTRRSLATVVTVSRGSVIAPSMKPSSACPSATARATVWVFPSCSAISMRGYWRRKRASRAGSQ